MCRRQQTGDTDCHLSRPTRWHPTYSERSRRNICLTDLALSDRLSQDNPELYQRAFAITTGFKMGVAMKKGQEPMLNALYDAIKIMQANGTEKKVLQANGMDPRH